MSTSAPDPSNVNANLLSVMQSLSNAVKQLSSNVQQLNSGSSVAPPTLPFPSGGSSTSGYTPDPASAAADLGTVRQQKLAATTAANTESAADAGNGGGAGPTSPPQTPQNPSNNPQAQEQAAISALTWESLGSLGGPLGRFRQSTYVAQQYQNVAAQGLSGVANSNMFNQDVQQTNADGSPRIDADGNPVMEPNAMLSSAANHLMNNSALNVGLAGVESAFATGTNFADIGQALGYGNRIGIAGLLHGQTASETGAADQGAALKYSEWQMYHQGGMTWEQSKQAVQDTAQAGFSNQNGMSGGDNTTIAQNLVKPLMEQGVSGEGATVWSEALRNAGTNVTALTSSLQNMSDAAHATKLTTDQFNSSLQAFAQSQVANGGTMGQGADTGMDFTAATGMAPSVFQQVQSNPVYQGLMMGENGVLPSDIGNLTPGAQLQGMQQMLQMYGGGLQGLNHNKYETVGGVRMVSSYGGAAEAAQIASMTGMTQSEVMRLQRETSSGNFNNVEQAMDVLGNRSGGIDGEGTGLFSILDKSKTWSGLNQHEKEQASRVWNAGIGKNINHMGLTSDEVQKINATHNVDQRASMLQKDLLGNQKNNPMNKITGTVELTLTGDAKKLVRLLKPSVQLKQANNAGLGASNSVTNSPFGASTIANDYSRFSSSLPDIPNMP